MIEGRKVELGLGRYPKTNAGSQVEQVEVFQCQAHVSVVATPRQRVDAFYNCTGCSFKDSKTYASDRPTALGRLTKLFKAECPDWQRRKRERLVQGEMPDSALPQDLKNLLNIQT